MRLVAALFIALFATPGGIAIGTVVPYSTEVAYEEGKPVQFADFVVTLDRRKAHEFVVAGVTRSNVTEEFSVALPTGEILKRSLTNGFPGDIVDTFGVRTSTRRFFAIRAFQGKMTAREVDHLESTTKVELGSDVDVVAGITFAYPDFDLVVVEISAESIKRKISPEEIDEWYVAAKQAYAGTAGLTEETRKQIYDSLDVNKASMQSNPEVETQIQRFRLRVGDETGNKELLVAGHETKETVFEFKGRNYVLVSAPANKSHPSPRLKVIITRPSL